VKTVECIICGETNSNHLISVPDRLNSNNKEIFNIVKCICGFIYLNPRPNISEIKSYYNSNEYDPHNQSKNSIYDKIYSFVQRLSFYRKRIIINRLISNPGTLVDIGGGKGDFCSYMKSYGWDAILQDSSELSLNIAKSKGLKTINSLDEISDIKSIDVFTLWHSLEHIHNIHDLLNTIKENLKEGKFAIFAVPNVNAPEKKYFNENWAPWDAPRHLYHFSRVTINSLLKKYELKSIHWETLFQDTPYNILLSIKSFSLVAIFKGIYILIYSWIKCVFQGVKSSSSFFVVCKKL